MRPILCAVVLFLSGCSSLVPSREACDQAEATYTRKGNKTNIKAELTDCDFRIDSLMLPLPGVR